jgi:FtsP/CotA-like multicopper oxidase with cupredoxin domain
MLKWGVAGGAGAAFSGSLLAAGWRSGRADAAVFDQPSPRTTPFVDPLPLPPPPNPVPYFLPDFTKYPTGPFAGFPSQHAKDIIDNRTQFYRLVEEEVFCQLHSELPPTQVWRYRDATVPAAASAFALGPTFKQYVNERPVNVAPAPGSAFCVRMDNELPAADAHLGFGVPRTTTHVHGGHHEARSDGFPGAIEGFDPLIERGQQFDYVFGLRDPGFSVGRPDFQDRPATLWYHDHLLDFTGPNVYRGLAGFYLLFDHYDTDDETGRRFPQFASTNLRLPSGQFDIPLAFQDRRLDASAQLIYLPENHDGVLGDKFLVNGKIQPLLEVEPRKYRFRLLDGSNARYYALFLIDERGRRQTFTQIAVEGGLLARPIRNIDRVFLAPSLRVDVVVDFSIYPAGTKLYFANFLDQEDGRGPKGDFKKGVAGLGLVRDGAETRLLQFRVKGGRVMDQSRVPDTLRPLDPIPPAQLAAAARNAGTFVFDRTGGAWAINGEFVDIDRPVMTPRDGQPVLLTLKNGGGGWWHPIHIHLEFMRVISRNGRAPFADEADGMAKRDTVVLGPGDEVQVYVEFRDFPGQWVFHCHNIEHEDKAMMARFDVLPR